jgi:hypothetical protein
MLNGWEKDAPPVDPFIAEPKGGLSHRPKAKKWKTTFPVLFFKVLFNNFWNFGILKNAKDEKSNLLWKRWKIKWQIFGEGENKKNVNGGRKVGNQIWDNYQFNLPVRASHFRFVSKTVSIP